MEEEIAKPRDWDLYYFRHVYSLAESSGDDATKIGAVIANEHTSIASGVNSFPIGLKDKPERRERPEKYKWFEHAERNAIFYAAMIGREVNGGEMYTQGIPCVECARAIVQSGIRVVHVHGDWEKKAEELFTGWEDRLKDSITMFDECDVKIECKGTG